MPYTEAQIIRRLETKRLRRKKRKQETGFASTLNERLAVRKRIKAKRKAAKEVHQ